MEEKYLEPVDKHGTMGVHLNAGTKYFPLDIVVGMVNSFDNTTTSDGLSIESRTTELRIGMQKTWRTPYGPRPFLSAGLVNISAELETTLGEISAYDEDSGSGFWARGGILWTAREFFNFGVDAAYSSAEGSLFGQSGDGGGFHFAFTVGLHFD